jgi:hypothetical protein
MIEFAIAVALIVISHRLRRQRHVPPQPLRIDIYHHWPTGGPGEREPPPLTAPPTETSGNVIPLHRRRE